MKIIVGGLYQKVWNEASSSKLYVLRTRLPKSLNQLAVKVQAFQRVVDQVPYVFLSRKVTEGRNAHFPKILVKLAFREIWKDDLQNSTKDLMLFDQAPVLFRGWQIPNNP